LSSSPASTLLQEADPGIDDHLVGALVEDEVHPNGPSRRNPDSRRIHPGSGSRPDVDIHLSGTSIRHREPECPPFSLPDGPDILENELGERHIEEPHLHEPIEGGGVAGLTTPVREHVLEYRELGRACPYVHEVPKARNRGLATDHIVKHPLDPCTPVEGHGSAAGVGLDSAANGALGSCAPPAQIAILDVQPVRPSGGLSEDLLDEKQGRVGGHSLYQVLRSRAASRRDQVPPPLVRRLARSDDEGGRESLGRQRAKPRLGAVSFLHRFGSALNPHPHFHLAVTDGLFVREQVGDNGSLRFRPAADLNAERARALTPILQRRILRLYVRRGLLTDADAEDMLTWRGTGGFSLDGSVRIAAHDRPGLERLLWGHRRAALVAPAHPSRCIVFGPPRRGSRLAPPTPA
jgi:hypothetical protein